jgi:hypothetical protein
LIEKMLKTYKINHIAIDKTGNLWYNDIMKNNNNKGIKTMTNVAHDVRVIKHMNGAYDTYANFPTVQDALDYMRRMAFGIDSWYIIDADDNVLRMNQQGKLVVTYSGLGVLATK